LKPPSPPGSPPSESRQLNPLFTLGSPGVVAQTNLFPGPTGLPFQAKSPVERSKTEMQGLAVQPGNEFSMPDGFPALAPIEKPPALTSQPPVISGPVT